MASVPLKIASTVRDANQANAFFWHEEIARLIDCVDSDDFLCQLIASLSELVPFSMSAVFAYNGRSRPVCLFDTFPDATARMGIENYVNGTYVLNPFYLAHLRGIDTGVYRITELAPDAYFEDMEMRIDKIKTAKREELGYITEGWPRGQEELIIAVNAQGPTTIEINLFELKVSGGFLDDELKLLNDHLPVIGAVLRKYWSLKSQSGDERLLDTRIDELFEDFGKSLLTDRERQVIQYVLRGHSSESISLHLEISITTVKTHRKRAYAKLGICSQSELLSEFLKFIAA